jgi:hypothetical protein
LAGNGTKKNTLAHQGQKKTGSHSGEGMKIFTDKQQTVFWY